MCHEKGSVLGLEGIPLTPLCAHVCGGVFFHLTYTPHTRAIDNTSTLPKSLYKSLSPFLYLPCEYELFGLPTLWALSCHPMGSVWLYWTSLSWGHGLTTYSRQYARTTLRVVVYVFFSQSPGQSLTFVIAYLIYFWVVSGRKVTATPSQSE